MSLKANTPYIEYILLLIVSFKSSLEHPRTNTVMAVLQSISRGSSLLFCSMLIENNTADLSSARESEQDENMRKIKATR